MSNETEKIQSLKQLIVDLNLDYIRLIKGVGNYEQLKKIKVQIREAEAELELLIFSPNGLTGI